MPLAVETGLRRYESVDATASAVPLRTDSGSRAALPVLLLADITPLRRTRSGSSPAYAFPSNFVLSSARTLLGVPPAVGGGGDSGGDEPTPTPVPVPPPDVPQAGERVFGDFYYVYGAEGDPIYFAVAWDVCNACVEGQTGVTYQARVAWDAGVDTPSFLGDSGFGTYTDASAYISEQLRAFLAALERDGETGIPGVDGPTAPPPEYQTYWYWIAPPYGLGELESKFIGGRSWSTYLQEFVKDGYEKVQSMTDPEARIEAFRAWVYYRAYTSIHIIFGFVDDTGVRSPDGTTFYYDISSKRYEMFERRAKHWLHVYREFGGPWAGINTSSYSVGDEPRGW